MRFSTSFEFQGFKVAKESFDEVIESGPMKGDLEIEMSVEEYIQLTAANKELGMEILSMAKDGLKAYFANKKQKLLGKE